MQVLSWATVFVAGKQKLWAAFSIYFPSTNQKFPGAAEASKIGLLTCYLTPKHLSRKG